MRISKRWAIGSLLAVAAAVGSVTVAATQDEKQDTEKQDTQKQDTQKQENQSTPDQEPPISTEPPQTQSPGAMPQTAPQEEPASPQQTEGNDQQARPSDQQATPSEQQAMPSDQQATPSDQQAMPEDQSKAGQPAKAEGNEGKKNIKILATGGTIAGAGTAGGYGYTSGQFKVEDLINAVPKLDQLANLSGEQVANVGSQDMNDQIWLKLAERVNALLADSSVDGVVITHGTDTMEETAYFLDLVVKSDKPVVLVGSMRPATAISPDGPANLYDAVATATAPEAKGRGVLVVLNNEIHYARNVEKMNTTNLQTFASPGRGDAGTVLAGKITWFEPMDKKNTTESEFSSKGMKSLPRVDIVYAYSNMDATGINAALKAGAKGIVVAGVGDGNMSKPALDALGAAAKRGIVVVRSTRLATGSVMRNAEVNDDQLGFVASGELNPGKSRVLTQLALTETKDPKKVQELFRTY